MVAYLSARPGEHGPASGSLESIQQLVVRNFQSYTVPVIILKKETPREAVCTVFEKVNTGGVPLNVFELLTATFASSHFSSTTIGRSAARVWRDIRSCGHSRTPTFSRQ